MNPAHDHPFEFGGEIYQVRRTFALIKSIEQDFDSLLSLQSTVRNGMMQFDNLAKLVQIILKDAAPDVDRARIEAVLMDQGNIQVAGECTKLLMSLFIGGKNVDAEKDDDGENPQTAATSTGLHS